MASDQDDGDWIDSITAIQLTVERTGRRLTRQILERARDGIVRARAKHYIVTGRKRDSFQITSGSIEEKEYSQHTLPKEFFWAGDGDALERDWTSGDFSTWIDQTWHCRAYGVQFLKADIVSLAPLISPTQGESDQAVALNKHSQSELEAWIQAAPSTKADTALNFYKMDPRYNGIKQDEFRSLWKRIKDTKRGAPPKNK